MINKFKEEQHLDKTSHFSGYLREEQVEYMKVTATAENDNNNATGSILSCYQSTDFLMQGTKSSTIFDISMNQNPMNFSCCSYSIKVL